MESKLYKEQFKKLASGIIWTHKIQRCYLEHLTKTNKCIKIAKYLFAAASSIATIITAVFDNKTATIILGLITVGALFLNLLLDNLVSDKDIKDFSSYSESLCRLRDKVLLSQEELEKGVISEEVAKEYFYMYDEQFHEINSKLPIVSDKYVDQAKKKLIDRKDEDPNDEFFHNQNDN